MHTSILVDYHKPLILCIKLYVINHLNYVALHLDNANLLKYKMLVFTFSIVKIMQQVSRTGIKFTPPLIIIGKNIHKLFTSTVLQAFSNLKLCYFCTLKTNRKYGWSNFIEGKTKKKATSWSTISFVSMF